MEMWSQNTWVFWLFPIMGLFIIQIYCLLRCYRSGWFQAVRERWLGAPQQGEAGNIQNAQIAAEAIPVAGAVPSSSYGAIEGDQGSQAPYVSMNNSRVLDGAHAPLSFPPPLPPPPASPADRVVGV